MYSMVLMMALSGGGADLPAGHGCRGCHGCYGGGHGCYGGGHGCYGGGHGCYGGGHGCRGGGGHFLGKHGCRGCHGGCYGGGHSSCYGGGYSGCHGGGYSGCYGGGYSGCHGGGVMTGSPAHMGAPAHGGAPKEAAPAPKPQSYLPAPATIVVSLPAEAKLLIDDTATTSTSTTRVFSSPVLEPGKDYVYTLKAEMEKDGKPVSTSKRITVRAGQETRVTFDLTESVASR